MSANIRAIERQRLADEQPTPELDDDQRDFERAPSGGRRLTDAAYRARKFVEIRARCAIDARGCWIWQGQTNKGGYGQTPFRSKMTTVHRAMYSIAKGEIPKGSAVCHTCDVRACCNPEHLWAGSAKENIGDMFAKGRAWTQQLTNCRAGHPYAEWGYRLSTTGYLRCRLCSIIARRLRQGWPADLAATLPIQKIGVRPRIIGNDGRRHE